MSKIKINEIESVNTNDDLTITPNGTGVFEVAGEDEQSSIQFNDSLQVNKVKVKAPHYSASQDYTMVLPATNITANTYLKVDSTTGSGSTATGQLGFHTITEADTTNLDGANFSSGTVPATRYSLLATQGAGLQHVQTQTVTSASTVTAIDFTGLENGAMYKFFIKNLTQEPGSYYSLFQILDSSGNAINSKLNWEMIYYDHNYHQGSTNDSAVIFDTYDYGDQCFVGEIYTADPNSAGKTANFGIFRGVDSTQRWSKMRLYFSTSSLHYTQIHGVRWKPYNSPNNTYAVGTEIAMYKYNETS
tara:strand:+ start:1239 stop:2147 length:909 start_codon:yes stop_codon:yes gene_type:complete